mmetsp:Transcript_13620/g.20780  ORF Transcript_13620/g.20780 Transcript_13620/m.20780 type:complete len:87 (-) Transcript_13620:117-377(-)
MAKRERLLHHHYQAESPVRIDRMMWILAIHTHDSRVNWAIAFCTRGDDDYDACVLMCYVLIDFIAGLELDVNVHIGCLFYVCITYC